MTFFRQLEEKLAKAYNKTIVLNSYVNSTRMSFSRARSTKPWLCSCFRVVLPFSSKSVNDRKLYFKIPSYMFLGQSTLRLTKNLVSLEFLCLDMLKDDWFVLVKKRKKEINSGINVNTFWCKHFIVKIRVSVYFLYACGPQFWIHSHLFLMRNYMFFFLLQY